MAHLERSVDVAVPVRVAYNQWTQFEEFPRFMSGVESVRQIDDTRLSWKAKIGGKDVEWLAQIEEQVPDTRIAWRTLTGAKNSGVVRFEKLPGDCTRISASIEYDPEGFQQSAAEALGFVSRRVQGDLDAFKSFIEKRGRESGAWRGEVHDAIPRNAPDSPYSPEAYDDFPSAPPA